MRVDVDVICNVCDSVFCCAQCRRKHELKHHAIVVEQKNPDDDGDGEDEESSGHTTKIYLFCSLCAKRPLELREHMYDEMVEHIRAKHLPLHCLKCHKRYSTLSDLRQFSKCLHPILPCHDDELAECSATTDQTSSSTDTSKVTVRRDYRQNGGTAAAAVTMSTQTSPMRHNFNETHLTTPIAVINSHWKAKYKISHEEMISDSVSSIRNLSSISNSSLRRSIDLVPKGKGTLVRSTSTPVHSEIVYAKPKEQIFNATGMGQVSSIYTSHCEGADNSPALPPAGMSPKPVENVNRYFKVGGRAKISAVTPLRQVMSKSIQKAFAEHGAPQSASFRPQAPVLHSRKIYDSHDSLGGESSSPPPLDLRLSPAMRRTKNRLSFNLQDLQPPSAHKNVIQPADVMMSTESIVITRTRYSRNSMAGSATNQSEAASTSSSLSTSESTTKNGSSVYKTCQSVEIITSTTAELSEVNVPPENDPSRKDDLGMLASALGFTRTPIHRSQGPITNKKLQFDTPHTKSAELQKSPMHEDVFFTPELTPARKPKLRRQSGDASPTSRADPDKAVMPRKLSNGFSAAARRPNLLECKDNEGFSHVQDVSDDDEVFLPQIASTNKQRSAEKFPRDEADGTDTTAVGKDLKSSWSLRSFVSSVMRLPVLKGKSSTAKDDKGDAGPSETSTNCSIKRSSSIAGSMVRPQSISENEKLNTLKRKRTYTMDNHHSMFLTQLNHSTEVSPPADHSLNVSSKKFRIQGRKPLERMRRDT